MVLFCLLGLAEIEDSQAQTDNQIWSNFAIKAPLDEKFSIGGDAGIRGLISGREWSQILIRPTATYRAHKLLKVSAGLALFSTFNVNTYNVNEFRLNQDFNLTWPDLGWSKLFFRLRFEERWFYYQDRVNNFSLRGRILGGIQSRDLTFLGEKRPIYLKMMLEGFIPFERDIEEVFVNNFRWYFALGHRLSKDWRYEVHYIRQISKLFDSSGSTTPQNIFRLRVFYSLDPKEEQIDDDVINPDGD
ncbi:DUF2490 domain-containing protein [Aureitalea marina]|uniref:DUF2490 domain-containing protein n=1 Tax=Aureitalea marina TaxID=930804 RepID=A0A2S7KM37_9FLAO|nr:DUF2490 domain-containing protein [Aureitalea marina]PQB03695.1 hypothetical protein BST85_01345 [Aureitalea marina]